MNRFKILCLFVSELFKTDANGGRRRTRLPKNMSYAAKKRKMGEEKGNKKFSKDRNEKKSFKRNDDDRKPKFGKNKKFDGRDKGKNKKPIKSGRVQKKRFSR